MDKVKVGVIGLSRGTSMINYCKIAKNAKLVAVCDKWDVGLERMRKELNDESVAFYSDYDEFLDHDMDLVILANYANEHAPFAIKAMNKGKNVLSEVLPCQTMKEAVELVETVERTGKIYCYGENYCYMTAPREIKRLYEEGVLGELEYAEGEYVHNCESIWATITYGDPDHWRNRMYANFYCTHSIGPLIHICGLRPVKVSGFEIPYNSRKYRMGCKGGTAGIEMITLENGAVLKSVHGDLASHSVWYSVYGEKGRAEGCREAIDEEERKGVYLETYPEDGNYDNCRIEKYDPYNADAEICKNFGHGGSDYIMLFNVMEKILGKADADVIDVYEAMDMFLPGMFAYRSVLNGGVPTEIPNLRNKEERDKWRNDTMCTDPKVAGDMFIPAYSKGEPEIPDEIYDKIKAVWEDRLSHTTTSYVR